MPGDCIDSHFRDFHHTYHKSVGAAELSEYMQQQFVSICQLHVRVSLQLEMFSPCLITNMFYMRRRWTHFPNWT